MNLINSRRKPSPVGVLLAAGFSRRFGHIDKLIQPLPSGEQMAVQSARHLAAALSHRVAVVRSENQALAESLRALGFVVVCCQSQATVMADSLALGIRTADSLATADGGYVVALADMPFIQVETITAVARALQQGAQIAQPEYQGQLGHPVGWSGAYKDALLTVQGDQGGRELLRREVAHIVRVPCTDRGIHHDIDSPAQLTRLSRGTTTGR